MVGGPMARCLVGPRRSRGIWALGLGVACFLGAGCSGGDRTPVYPVQGQVKFKGEPASGAFLVFHPVDAPAAQAAPEAGAEGAPAEPIRPRATVLPDGSFTLTTFDGGDGAPAGEYAVTLQWYKTVIRDKAPEAGPNVIPASYGKPDTTPLKITIKPETNALEPWDIVTR
jgi:hypothetical protein